MLKLNAVTSFRANDFACLKLSENNIISAISSFSGVDIRTGRNNCFKFSGKFWRPPKKKNFNKFNQIYIPYSFPAGFIVIKSAELKSIFTGS